MAWSASARYGIPVVVAAVFFALCYWVLSVGHPAEDAYILFKYADNLSQGHGIVFNPGGEHAEGATDFLYLILISALGRLGLDVAVGAALLNALGAGACSAVLFKLADSIDNGSRTLLGATLFSALLLVSAPAAASYAGFSAMFLVGIVAVSTLALITATPGLLMSMPLLGLTLGLTRPDALLVGISFVMLGALRARAAGALRNYGVTTAVAASVGILYFLWRWNYFDNLLPLPLYVKSTGGRTFAGVADNAIWLQHIWTMPAIASVAYALQSREARRTNRWAKIAVLSVLPLIVALCFANQTQNVAERFQAPATIVILLSCFVFVGSYTRNFSPRSAALIWLGVTACIALQSYAILDEELQRRTRHSYINVFPAAVSPLLPADARIALTEAGRLAYWLDAAVTDLVGLNTNFTARNEPDSEFLQSIEADFIMLKKRTSRGEAAFLRSRETEIVVELSSTDIDSLLREAESRGKRANSLKTRVAPRLAYAYLLSQPKHYRTFATLYGKHHDHVYAVNPSRIDVDKFVALLEATHSTREARSYLELKSVGRR